MFIYSMEIVFTNVLIGLTNKLLYIVEFNYLLTRRLFKYLVRKGFKTCDYI